MHSHVFLAYMQVLSIAGTSRELRLRVRTLRSILNATEGLTRKHNPRKQYGPQQDVWCSFAIGAVISAHVISSLQSESDSFRYCMQTCAQAVSFDVALQYGFSSS